MKIAFPHALIIMMGFILLAALATYVVPSGSFERILDEETGREIVVPGSYKLTENQNISLTDTGLAIPEGIILGSDIMVLILLVVGAFYVVEKTGALQVGIGALVYQFRNSQHLLLVIFSGFFFLGGASFGMQEEIIAMTTLATIGIYFSQVIIHGIVPSTSGQAVLTIPLAAPLTDLLGVSRQIAVLAYQYPAG